MSLKIFATTDPVDEKKLEDYLNQLISQEQKNIHFDVMDGEFVSSKKIAPKTIITLSNKFEKINFGVHLMAKNPSNYVQKLTGAKIKKVFAHIEAFENSEEIDKFVLLCKKNGFVPCLAINPNTKLNKTNEKTVESLKNVLIMGVVPGKSGQKLISSTLNKIKKLKQINEKISVAFDGGVNEKNINKVIGSGVDEICLGSLMFKLNQAEAVCEFLKKFKNNF